MKIVIVNEGLAYPPTAGNRIRTMNLMIRLARRHQVTYICRGGWPEDEIRQQHEFLTSHGIETLVVDDPVQKNEGARFYGRLAANLLSPLPYAVSSHNSPMMRKAIREYATRHRVDIWQFEWLGYADALAGLPDAKTVVMAHNVESLIWQRYYETEKHPLKKAYIKHQWRKYERFERRIFEQATRVVTVSPPDAELVVENFGVNHVSVVDNGIDKEYFSAVERRPDPSRILFMGSLDWRPNLDAANQLLDEIFPRVLARVPDARLMFVGRNPGDNLMRKIKAAPRVELHANVPDVRPYLAQAGVMAVPLRVGGGSRLKILEALAAGVPVVSSAVGYEGLHLTPSRHLLVANDTEQFANTLVECIHVPAWAGEIARRGQQFVLNRYDWDALADRLEEAWLECLNVAPLGQAPVKLQHAQPTSSAILKR